MKNLPILYNQVTGTYYQINNGKLSNMNLEQHVENILENYPHVHGDNTEICIQMWKNVAAARGVYIDVEMWDIIRKFKPESVPRARRKLAKKNPKAESTTEQLVKEQRFMQGEIY